MKVKFNHFLLLSVNCIFYESLDCQKAITIIIQNNQINNFLYFEVSFFSALAILFLSSIISPWSSFFLFTTIDICDWQVLIFWKMVFFFTTSFSKRNFPHWWHYQQQWHLSSTTLSISWIFSIFFFQTFSLSSLHSQLPSSH